MTLKLLLMGSLAQIGLALATAVGAWINLLLVLGFAVRANYLELDRPFVQSLLKFLCSGVVLGLVLLLTARLATAHLAPIGAFRDVVMLLLLAGVGAAVYAGSILILFGKGWLKALVRG
jgi:putative peptidoglycan lipid II flippase